MNSYYCQKNKQKDLLKCFGGTQPSHSRRISNNRSSKVKVKNTSSRKDLIFDKISKSYTQTVSKKKNKISESPLKTSQISKTNNSKITNSSKSSRGYKSNMKSRNSKSKEKVTMFSSLQFGESQISHYEKQTGLVKNDSQQLTSPFEENEENNFFKKIFSRTSKILNQYENSCQQLKEQNQDIKVKLSMAMSHIDYLEKLNKSKTVKKNRKEKH